jgi:hypothetical protein
MPSVLIRVLCLILLLAAGAATAAPRAELWERWTAHDPQAMRQIDHGAWEKFLMRYVRIGADGSQRVAYSAVTPADRRVLEGYIEQLANVPISRYNRTEQLAYWINLYNALMVRLVLDHYPIGSVRNLGAGSLWTGAPWTVPQVEIEGAALSLSDIEHRILRPIWQDPRVLYALSCGALGCPSLQPEPFLADRLERQLNEAAMAYVNDPRCIRFPGQTLEVSSLFRWYQEDFGGSERAVINHLMAYAEPQLAMRLQNFERITGEMFDWRLNDAAP